MKTYKTAKAILQHSLADIEAGHWCKNNLCEIIEFDDDGASVRKDPLRCALGLISMYGGNTETQSYYDRGGKLIQFQFDFPKYPSEGSPQGVLDALDALFLAIPKKYRNRENYGSEVEMKNTTVYDYNDRDSMKRYQAARWFRRAIELL